ncbi:hypothetical protein Tco_0286046 [Tanacetum coccineum]
MRALTLNPFQHEPFPWMVTTTTVVMVVAAEEGGDEVKMVVKWCSDGLDGGSGGVVLFKWRLIKMVMACGDGGGGRRQVAETWPETTPESGRKEEKWGLHYLVDKVVRAGTAQGPNQ